MSRGSCPWLLLVGMTAALLPTARAEGPALEAGWAALPPGAVARLGSSRLRHARPVVAVALSPDGKSVASVSAGGEGWSVLLWDTHTGRELRRFKTHGGSQLRALAFSPDGRLLAASHEGAVTCWEVATSKVVCHVSDAGRPVTFLAFLPDNRSLAVGGEFSPVSVWDVRSVERERLWSLWPGKQPMLADGEPAETCYPPTLSPDGKLLACRLMKWRTVSAGRHFCEDEPLRLIDLTTGKQLWEVNEHAGSGSYLAFSPDGRTLAAGTYRLRLWDVAGGRVLHDLAECRSPVVGLGFTAGGKVLVSIHRDGTLQFWDVAAGELLRELAPGPDGLPPINENPDRAPVSLTADGRLLALASESGVYLWNPMTGMPRLAPDGHGSPILGLRFAADGRTVTSRSETARYDWNTKDWNVLRRRNRPRLNAASGPLPALSPDGDVLIRRIEEHALAICDPEMGKVLHRLEGDFDGRERCWFTPDGRRVLLQHDPESDPLAALYDLGSGKRLIHFPLDQPTGEPVFSPDGAFLAWGGAEGTVQLFETATGKKLLRLEAPPGARPHQRHGYGQLVFSPDGQRLAAVTRVVNREDEDADLPNVRVWDCRTGLELRHGDLAPPISSLAFSPDGRVLAAALQGDRHLVLWEVVSGKERHRFTGQAQAVRALAFSPDQRYLLSGDDEGVILVWDLKTDVPSNLDSLEKLEACWETLAEVDPRQAERAVRRLAGSPARSVPLLRAHLHPVKPLPPGRLDKLIADLDDDDFATRERASAELAKVLSLAEPALATTLGKQPSAEARHRIEVLLGARTGSAIPPERLREVRAIAVLEYAGCPEATALLKMLADGAPEALLTREAKGALERLSRH